MFVEPVDPLTSFPAPDSSSIVSVTLNPDSMAISHHSFWAFARSAFIS
jgi:hypothetical protein